MRLREKKFNQKTFSLVENLQRSIYLSLQVYSYLGMFNLSHYDHGEDHKWFGQFWLPDKPEFPFSAEIQFLSGVGIKIEGIMPQYIDNPFQGISNKGYEILHGVIHGNKHSSITLIKVLLNQTKCSFGSFSIDS